MSCRTFRRAITALALASLSTPALAAPRDTLPSDSLPTSQSSPQRSESFITRGDLLLTAGLTGAAAALMPLDRAITHWVRRPAHLDNGAIQGTLGAAEWGVEKGAVMAGMALWGTGLALRNRDVAETGVHTLASILVTQQVTHLLKGTFGRSRPYQSSDAVAHDWRWGSGFGTDDRRSFPSGHTSMAFATATALSHEISRTWPRAGRVATPLLYLGATGAALARVYHDQHWASDVTVGAAVGILSTRATLRLLHGHENNWLDRFALNASIVPQRGGATLAFSFPQR